MEMRLGNKGVKSIASQVTVNSGAFMMSEKGVLEGLWAEKWHDLMYALKRLLQLFCWEKLKTGEERSRETVRRLQMRKMVAWTTLVVVLKMVRGDQILVVFWRKSQQDFSVGSDWGQREREKTIKHWWSWLKLPEEGSCHLPKWGRWQEEHMGAGTFIGYQHQCAKQVGVWSWMNRSKLEI